MRKAAAIFLASCLFLFPNPASAEINHPECELLASWADTFVPPQARTGPASIPDLFRDKAFEKLFGKTLDSLEKQDFRSLDDFMKGCQQKLFKHHRQKAKQINKVRRHVPSVQRALAQSKESGSKAKGISPQQAYLDTTVDRLENYHPSRRLAGQIALTRDVMLGKPADLEAHGLREMPNWINQVEHARSRLTEAEMAPYIQRLAEREAELQAEFKKDDEAFASLQKELAAVPISQNGLARLRQLQRSSVIAKATPQQQDEFRAEVQRKHMKIQAEMQRQQQARRSNQVQRPTGTDSRQAGSVQEGGMPVTLVDYLVKVITGNDVEDALLLGLKPGVDHREAIRHVKKEQGFKEALTLSMTQGYGRGARMMEFTTMEDLVGQIEYTDYFKVAIDPDAILEILNERYGDPDETRKIDGGLLLTWEDGDQYLQVLATNRVHNAVKYKGYHSRLSIALWSEGYSNYLEEVNERCAEIWDKTRSELSMNDKKYLGAHCPLMPGTKKAAGIGSLI